MSNTILLTLLGALISAVSTSPISSRDEVVTCTETTTENAFANPSWEDGTSGWEYNGVPSTTNAYSSDGSYSLLISGNLVATSYVRQTISNLQIGLTYNVSVDLKAVVNPVYSVMEQCFLYIYHDSLTTNNLITSLSKQYTRADSAWTTYGGTVTPTSTDMEIGMVLSCSPYHTSVIFNAYLDNAIMNAPIQSCSTVTPTSTPSPTSTSFASSTNLPIDSSSTSEGTATSASSSSFTSSEDSSSTSTSTPTVVPSDVSTVSPEPTSASITLLPSFASSNTTQTTLSSSASLTDTPLSASSSAGANDSSVSTITSSAFNTSVQPASTISAAVAMNGSTSSASTILENSSIFSSPLSTTSPANVTGTMSSNQASAQTPLPFNTSSPQELQSSTSGSESVPVTISHTSSMRPPFPTITVGPMTTSQGLNLSVAASSDTEPTSMPAPTTQSSGGLSAFASASGEQLTTLTVLTTSIHTVLSCAPFVTNCPANSAVPTSLPEGVSISLVTETIELSTTIYPVTAAEALSASILSAAATGLHSGKTLLPTQTPSTGDALTTLTVRSTSIRTAVSCAPTVTSCPVRNATALLTRLPEGMSTVLITETLDLSTTVCPVTAAESILSSILSVAARGGMAGKVIAPSLTQGGSLGLLGSSGTTTPVVSATFQTANPTTLKPVVKKPCHHK
ncbi:hypothetical protein N0V93_004732 [Gnomoniopsis smithogilvyi]|uniref:CBM-cenC domain-containing protein n=1 Tax=Gnomoniopsis smithogilvyi TaxID=1191159 RepID=A0A9W8YRK5_9PEZI|nr:hypothetical protein N0V93_004732 [Gnomoniopsis smithogilvyi]